MSRRAWYLFIGVAFAVHNSEEALAAGRLLEFMQSHAPAFVGTLYVGTTPAEMQVNLLVLTVLGFVLSTAAARSPNAAASVFSMMVFAAVLGLNAIAHIGLSIASLSYMPGLVTAVWICLPLSMRLLVRARREAWVSSPAFWAIIPAAVFVHGPVLMLVLILLAVFR